LLRRLSTVAILTIASVFSAAADTLVLQGSTTFADHMLRHQAEVQKEVRQKLRFIPNKTGEGLLALASGRADFAMTSGPVESDREFLKRHNPDFPFDDLRVFEITRTRMAFAVYPGNPVNKISMPALRKVLLGDIRNWREVGGHDLPITIVLVREGGGVQASVERHVLQGKPITVEDRILVQISPQVAKVVEQNPEGLGLAQLNVVQASKAKELATSEPIEQRLSLITLGEPNAAKRDVIEAMRRVVARATE
jgi:phosphate transport system substrate-binding protein